MERIYFWILFAFGLFGAMVMGISIHEFRHYYDLKDYVNADGICALYLPMSNFSDAGIGYYFYNELGNVEDEAKKSESKAYFLGFIPLTLFFIVALLYIKSRFDNDYKVVKDET